MSKTLKSVLIIIALMAGGLAIGCSLSSCGGDGGGSNPPVQGGNPSGENDPSSSGGSGTENTVFGSADADNNEVPDEIDAWIKSVAPTSAKLRAALTKNAVVYTHALLDASDPGLSRDHATEMDQIAGCLVFLVGVGKMIDLTEELEAEFLSSSERSRAYLEYDSHLGGIYPSPPTDGSTCGNDILFLPN